MSKLLQQEIPYHQDSSILVNQVANSPWTVFLDSCRPESAYGRYDIIATEPVATLTTKDQLSQIASQGAIHQSTDDPFQLLRGLLGEPVGNTGPHPFIGGAMGYFGYDLARRIERLPALAKDDAQIPDLAVGIYDWAVVVDHKERKTFLISAGRDESTHRKWDSLVDIFSNPTEGRQVADLAIEDTPTSNMTRGEYQAAFNKIQQYITAGDCYQVNLSQRFSVPCRGNMWSVYRKLRKLNPSPYSAFLNLPFGQILSSSPERFLELRSDQVETKPIKGTRPRSPVSQIDRQNMDELAESKKDRAENLMIVDLLRNDLGKTCVPGSIQVLKLFDIESFPNVHHLVSTIRGVLADNQDALSLLRSAFPGGSITGAPKLRAMEIIEELEPHRRGVYCGAIGYIGYDGDMDSNIAIRTFLYKTGILAYPSGGGIVADSVDDEENLETYHKAKGMFDLLGMA